MVTKKHSKRNQIILFIAGLLFACGGIYFLIHNITTYINQFDQKDWPVTTATIISVHEYHNGHRSRSTRYDILYQYEAEGNVYTGKIHGSNAVRNLGETFEVKYRPGAPEESTRHLEPDFGIVGSGVVGFIIFGFIGFSTIKRSLPKE